MAVSLLGTQTFTTTSGTKTVTATPALSDFIVIITAHTGNTASVPPTDNNSDGLGTYTRVVDTKRASDTHTMQVWVRDAPIGSASSTVFTHAPGASTGGGLAVFKATGITLTGMNAIVQYAKQDNQSSGGTPTPLMASAVNTANHVIGAVFNATNPAGLTERTSYTEAFDVGYATPTTGLEAMYRNSGETNTSLAWGGTSASAFCSVVIEINTSTTPTVALNTADGTSTSDTTPTLEFTGTDTESNELEYQTQIDTVNTFDSTGVGFYDDFNDNSIDTAKWSAWGGAQVTEANSALKISNPASDTTYYGIISQNSYDFTGLTAVCQLVNAGNQGLVSWEVHPLNIRKDSNNGLKWLISNGFMISRKLVGGVNTGLATTAYNPTIHKWFRIRESGGTVYWDWSTDGVTWTNHASELVSNLFVITALSFEMFTGTYNLESQATAAIFDNIRMGKEPLIDKNSVGDTGFANTVTGGDTHPFNSGEKASYTVQSALSLTTYYWRVRAKDPAGSNIYGAWATTRSFTITTGGATYRTRPSMLLGVG